MSSAETHGCDVGLPPELVMWEQAGRLLRSFLDANGLQDWLCFFRERNTFDDIDAYLSKLDEPSIAWALAGPFSPGGFPPGQFDRDDDTGNVEIHPPGCLWLRRHGVVILRWFQERESIRWETHLLFAAPTAECFDRLRVELNRLRRKDAPRHWKYVFHDGTETRRREPDAGWESLILPASIRRRLQREVIDFFSDASAAMYGELKIPYRRGVLLHGPPGNGKTSLIRALGALNLHIAAIVLRPGRDFTDEDFARAIELWESSAPAMLVIEDLDWLLPRLNVSTFLNHLDGINNKGDGLLIIATTNHPEELDPAVNNRPGRFDVVIEIPSPTPSLRLEYLRRSSLAPLGDTLLKDLAEQTDGHSFAHLREIESISGLMAAGAGRSHRLLDEVREAARSVVASHAQAKRGFPGRRKRAGFEVSPVED